MMIDIKLLPRLRYMYEKGDGGCLYIGKQFEAVYISLHISLHNGWKNYPKVFWNKGGWRYHQPAILIGNQKTGKSKWYKFPEILIPNRLVHLWLMRKKTYRKFYKEDIPLKKEESNDFI